MRILLTVTALALAGLLALYTETDFFDPPELTAPMVMEAIESGQTEIQGKPLKPDLFHVAEEDGMTGLANLREQFAGWDDPDQLAMRAYLRSEWNLDSPIPLISTTAAHDPMIHQNPLTDQLLSEAQIDAYNSLGVLQYRKMLGEACHQSGAVVPSTDVLYSDCRPVFEGPEPRLAHLDNTDLEGIALDSSDPEEAAEAAALLARRLVGTDAGTQRKRLELVAIATAASMRPGEIHVLVERHMQRPYKAVVGEGGNFSLAPDLDMFALLIALERQKADLKDPRQRPDHWVGTLKAVADNGDVSDTLSRADERGREFRDLMIRAQDRFGMSELRTQQGGDNV